MKKFKPILAPNDEPKLEDIQYPLLASRKLDGIRCIFKQGEMLSRSLKPIVNKQLREKFLPLIEYTKENNVILDGEIYSHDLTFQEITRYVMTQDFEDKRSIKKFGKVLTIPESLKFNCFDMLGIFEGEIHNETEFFPRLKSAMEVGLKFPDIMTVLINQWVADEKQVKKLFEQALEDGYEGLILRKAEGKYKFGRCTIKEGNLFKVKPFRTFDGQIIAVTQGTDVNPNAEKKTNELGRSVTSTKKADRILVERTRDFVVIYEGKELKVSTGSLTHEDRAKYWKKRESLIGQWIEYKGMLVGAKDVPRHPIFIRFREPKD
jgi:DNA ligase-1